MTSPPWEAAILAANYHFRWTSIWGAGQAIASGRPVGLGVPVFKNAWEGGYSYLRGEVTLPLVEVVDGSERVLDTHKGSHAICIVGYRNNDPSQPDSDRPGGGYFLFRNSWGTIWSQSPKEKFLVPGYGILPYSYAERYWLDAYVIDSLLYEGKELGGQQRPSKGTEGEADSQGRSKSASRKRSRKKGSG